MRPDVLAHEVVQDLLDSLERLEPLELQAQVDELAQLAPLVLLALWEQQALLVQQVQSDHKGLLEQLVFRDLWVALDQLDKLACLDLLERPAALEVQELLGLLEQ